MKPYHEPPFLRTRPPAPSDDPLSLVALVQNGTLDADLAALLWLTVARRGSIVVAAAPRLPGKTTVLSAVLDLAPAGTELVYTHGESEKFAFLDETDPGNTVIVVNEISDHLPIYLWGWRVLRVFEALERGYSMGATLHADTPEEVLEVLLDPEVGATPALVRQVCLIVNLAVVGQGDQPARRVRSAHVVVTDEDGRLGAVRLAAWDAGTDSFQHEGAGALAALAARLGLSLEALDAELSVRRGDISAAAGPLNRADARWRLVELT